MLSVSEKDATAEKNRECVPIWFGVVQVFCSNTKILGFLEYSLSLGDSICGPGEKQSLFVPVG